MADYIPPTGPPPPRVPEGWKAVFNDQYKEWFYVNLYTKQSTWEKPTAPAHRPDDDAPPGGPPPLYSGPGGNNVSDAKRRSFDSNNPYKQGNETDEEMARRMQAEENARRDRGEAEGYYQGGAAGGGPNPTGLQGGYPGAPSSASPTGSATKSRGFLSKLMGGKHSS
ncbi:WW domain-containing protein wwm1, partial [Exophiala xenobiotica]